MTFVSKITLSAALSAGVIYLIAFCFNKRPAPPFNAKRRNKNGKYRIPEGWTGTPSDAKKRFLNHQHPFYQNYVDIVKWLPSHAINLIKNRNEEFPVLKCKMSELVNREDILIWLGHASFLIKVSGKAFLIDPHFHNMFPYKRHTKNPIPAEQFTAIDYILISHDHADHLNKKSIAQLVLQNQSVKVLSGLKMEKIIQSYTGIQKDQIVCADWFEQYPISEDRISIHFVPTRHYNKRLDTGFNKALWGGFIIEWILKNSRKTVIFFGGDSGYGNHYKMIKDIYKPDVAIMGIGAYAPDGLWNPIT